jgi:hypothetical protein
MVLGLVRLMDYLTLANLIISRIFLSIRVTLGISLAPATGKLLAQQVLDKITEIDLEGFSPQRFGN